MTKQATTDKKQVNASLLKLADVHLLAAVGEDVSRAYGRHSEYLTVMLRVLQAHGYSLEEVQRRWNEVIKGKE
jgi:hypothetical protein